MLFLTPDFWPLNNNWTCQKSCFLIRRGLKKPFFLSSLPQGGLVLPNKSQLSNLQNGHTEMLFLTPHFWPFKNHWTCQKSCFLIRRGLNKPFFYPTSPNRVLFCQNKSQLSNLQNGHREMLFLTPDFWPLNNNWTCQKSCFLIRRGLKKSFFLSDLPQGGLVLLNNNQLSNLQNKHRGMLFLTPHFWPLNNNWICQKSCFLIRRGLKKPFFLSSLSQGGLVLPNKSQLSNLQNGHTEMLF